MQRSCFRCEPATRRYDAVSAAPALDLTASGAEWAAADAVWAVRDPARPTFAPPLRPDEALRPSSCRKVRQLKKREK